MFSGLGALGKLGKMEENQFLAGSDAA